MRLISPRSPVSPRRISGILGCIMHALLAQILFFMALPFWEANPPEKWSLREIELLRVSSPWALTVGPEPEVVVYLATAAPIEQAESELRLRAKRALR